MEIVKVFGPPGTGKTYRMLQIMEEELGRGIQPDRLAFLSFTVQARREAMERAMVKFGLTEDDLPNFKTLHAICYRELGMTLGSMVTGNNDLRELAEDLGIRLTYRQGRHALDDLAIDMPSGGEVGDRILQFDHVRRHNLLSLEEAWRGKYDDDLDDFQVRRFISAYETWKKKEARLDFTDLLEHATVPLDIDVVIVDEAQDLSRLQWATLHRLAARAARLYLAGDDDQAIFTWAGADPRAFVEHPGRVTVLDQSYRLPGAVHRAAERITAGIRERQPKVYRARAAAGAVHVRSNLEHLTLDPGQSYLLLYRHHFLVEEVEQLVRQQGLPYKRADRKAPGAEWGPAIIFWERLRKGQELGWYEVREIVEAMAVNLSPGISAETRGQFLRSSKKTRWTAALLSSSLGLDPQMLSLPWYSALSKIQPIDVQYLRAIISLSGAKALTEVPKIRLSTIHAAKGAEADHVVLLTDMTRRVLENYHVDGDNERRVFYVGVTRARETLTLVGLHNPIFWG